MINKSISTKNRKPLYLLLLFLLVFSLFIYFITRPSLQSIAIKELNICYNSEDVKQTWYKYKSDLSEDETYLKEIRIKLNSFHLPENELISCIKWLPPAPTSMNLIIVPDLSRRIEDTINNPDQINNDTIILNSIWDNFVTLTKFKTNSKDRLVLDVTDEGQAGGEFRKVANNLIFDLSENQGKSNRIYYNNVGTRFKDNVRQLYILTKKNGVLGADYHHYFNQKLSNYIKKSSLLDNYRNVLIIISDGYLEAQNANRTNTWAYTGTYDERINVSNQIRAGKSYKEAFKFLKPIQDCSFHYPDLEVLILEVSPRTKISTQEGNDPGTINDYYILRYQWMNWLKLLEVKNANDDIFVMRNDATQTTKNKIKEFLNK